MKRIVCLVVALMFAYIPSFTAPTLRSVPGEGWELVNTGCFGGYVVEIYRLER